MTGPGVRVMKTVRTNANASISETCNLVAQPCVRAEAECCRAGPGHPVRSCGCMPIFPRSPPQPHLPSLSPLHRRAFLFHGRDRSGVPNPSQTRPWALRVAAFSGGRFLHESRFPVMYCPSAVLDYRHPLTTCLILRVLPFYLWNFCRH